jgi:hypothetical protein
MIKVCFYSPTVFKLNNLELIIDENMEDRQNRELVHSIACEMDLRTQSSHNQVRVTKPHNTRSVILLNAQRVKMDEKQNSIISDHFNNYPIDPSLVDDHMETDLGSKYFFEFQ